MRSGEETPQSLTSCCQSSNVLGRKVKASVPSNSKWFPCVATRHLAPGSRSRETNASPTPEASAKTSHDFSSGACKRISGGLEGLACHQADLTFASGWADQTRQGSRFNETSFPQHHFPLCSLE